MDAKVLAAIVGAIAGIAGTYLGAILKFRKDLALKYDIDLRKKRIREYRELWKLLQPLAKYARPGPLTCQAAQQLSYDLRQWYYERGGMFLSDRSRDAYFALQDSLKKEVVDSHSGQPDAPLAEEAFERIREKGSALRTALTVDVGTRKKPEAK